MILQVRLGRDGQGLEVELPSGYSIKVPLAGQTAEVLERILIAGAAGPAPIGTAASPTQAMVQDWLKRGGRTKRLTENGRLDVTLEELGLG